MDSRKALTITGFSLMFLGVALILGSALTITGAVTAQMNTTTGSFTGFFFIILSGFFLMTSLELEKRLHDSRMAREKCSSLKSLRKFIQHYKGGMDSLMEYAVDQIAHVMPEHGLKSTHGKRREIKELKQISSMISDKYHAKREDVFDWICDELHHAKKLYGRKDR